MHNLYSCVCREKQYMNIDPNDVRFYRYKSVSARAQRHAVYTDIAAADIFEPESRRDRTTYGQIFTIPFFSSLFFAGAKIANVCGEHENLMKCVLSGYACF